MSAFAGCVDHLAILPPGQGASEEVEVLREIWRRAREEFEASATVQYGQRRFNNPFTADAALFSQNLKLREASQVASLLDEFADAASRIELEQRKALRASLLDDGALLIEWTLADRRLGFSFEQTPEESGWYFVYSRGSSERYEAGTMDQLEVARLLRLMTET